MTPNACGRRLWSSEWYKLFDLNYTCKSTDPNEANDIFAGSNNQFVKTMTWRDRFKKVADHPGVIQLYSSGENVVRQATEGDPGLGQYGTAFNGGVGAWNFQEKSKGTKKTTALVQKGLTQGGWGFNICSVDQITNDPTYCNELTADEAFALHNETLRQSQFFNFTKWLYPDSQQQVNEMLAYAIPALSFGSGGARIDKIFSLNNLRSINMNTYPGSGSNPDWPRERRPDVNPRTGLPRLWRHGDYKDVAYRYVHEFYDEIVTRGLLK